MKHEGEGSDHNVFSGYATDFELLYFIPLAPNTGQDIYAKTPRSGVSHPRNSRNILHTSNHYYKSVRHYKPLLVRIEQIPTFKWECDRICGPLCS